MAAKAKKTSAVKAKAKKPLATKRATKAAPARKSRGRKSAARPVAPVVHWEIQARDPKKLHAFYGKLFGWTIEANNPMNYGMVASRGAGGINGGIGGAAPDGPTRVLVYATVPNIDRFLAKAEALGARTIMPRTDIGILVMGVFADLEGNHFGVIEG
jgi:predicted enzyme related to lactoylglutathione lyase